MFIFHGGLLLLININKVSSHVEHWLGFFCLVSGLDGLGV